MLIRPLGQKINTKGRVKMIKIDKSLFTADELAQYEALIAKGAVETEDEIPEEKPAKKTTEEKEVEDMVETAKSAEVAPEIKDAMERLETMEKSFAMKEFTEIAKKYAPLGEKEEELAKTLYEMKKSNQANYDAYIGVLDKSLDLVEKSGVFSEIGKSASGTTGGAVEKVEAAADEIMKSDASISRVEAIAKAWEEHPEFVAEYEKEFNA